MGSVSPVDFGILGPLQVRRGVDPVEVGGAKPRAVLAMLLIHANEVVSSDRLIDAIWADHEPADAAHALQAHVSGLRKVLEPGHAPGAAWRVVVTKTPGYVIEIAPEHFDRSRFEGLAGEGRRALASGQHARAADALAAALALWRGEALADFAYRDFAAPEATRLNEQRLGVLEDRIDADLALGRHIALVDELRAAAHVHPSRERLWAQLMVALYRSGRQADALQAYQELARRLRDELGLSPSPELARLEEAILVQKPELDRETPTTDAVAQRDGVGPGVGTVTVLFTDLVGSTELLVGLGEDRFDSVRDEHDVLVGGAIAAHYGEIVKHTGDGYMAVFARAADAIAAAAEIQRLISKRNESSEVALGVRVGISAGDVVERAGDYHGVAAVEAARLCSAATGSQILASETARSLAGSRGSHDFVALGELDLKDLPPLATVAVRWCDDAPVLAPARAARGNLPASLDSFIGRQHDFDAIRGLLGEHRLVTLTGPGGSGKTRLALEVARSLGAEHIDGVWLVDLAPIDDEQLVAEATMAALGLRGTDAPALDVLRSHLARRDVLLVLDNCEHVLGGAPTLIAELLAACPRMRVLATSREALRVPGEAEYAVEGLVRDEAVELLAERVPGQHRLDEPDVLARICGALEGIPLAIELAAGRLRVFSPAQLADRLDDQLAVLVRGSRTAPERQRTLRATLDWSYDLLDDDERIVFRRLGVFAGGFTPDAASHVVADDQIPGPRVPEFVEQLLERSLVTRAAGGADSRFRLLEPVRQYAAARLGEAGEQNALARRHLEWITQFARQAFVEFFAAQRDSTTRISEEHPNICQALEFAIANGDGIPAARIIDSLAYPWYTTGQPDARLWCERVLAVVPADAPAFTRAGALVATAIMLQEALEYDAALNLLLEARELYRSAKSLRGEAWTLTWLGRDAYARAPASAKAQALFEEALSCFRESGVPAGIGWCTSFLAKVALHAEDAVVARQRAEEAVQLGRSADISQIVADGLHVLAILDHDAGDFENADRQLAEMIAIHEAAGDRYQLAFAHPIVVELATERGDFARAATHVAAGAELAGEVLGEGALELIAAAAYLAYFEGYGDNAAVLFGVWIGHSPLTFPKRFRPIVEALEKQGLREKIAAGANLDADEALERAIEVINLRPSAPT